MVNSVVLIGRLTKDPELRTTGSGTPVVSFTLAVNRRFKSQGQPDADFINCVAWNKTAETMARYLHKGSLIAITGRIQTRNYENQQGQRVYVTEVVADSFDFLESKNAAGAGGNQYAQNPYGGNSYSSQNYGAGAANYNTPEPAQNGYGNSQSGYGNSQPAASYSQPSSFQGGRQANPYASQAADDLSSGYGNDETLDLSTDDLPF
ncbi:single-stranded DNA-binding protein [uncultured Faecalibaculum sp.]|uniref:single-stranded DNA-binding protein n=1 Tax=uncultured Faecalibaculum sp. TaxID=1729681 RepID=UPI002631D1A3|nr:single-stranded DNA-binding protein [uncultured Faecalibaculum sp.]